MSKGKTCKSCFRYCENWRDAEAKNLPPRKNRLLYAYKPRPGVEVIGSGIGCCPNPINGDLHACEWHIPRWKWNIGQWRWEANYLVTRLWEEHIRAPLGSLRKPVPLKWADSYDVATDSIIDGGEPRCPYCGEMPYNTKRCMFCGQRFTDERAEWDG